jgi:hypothetical protein
MRRASIGLLLAAALLVSAPGARAAGSPDVDSTGVVSGQIVLSWHGDPARGCTAAGVCDVSGSLVYRPEQIQIQGRQLRSGRFLPNQAFLESSQGSTVRVTRGGSAVCVDSVDTSDFILAPKHRGGSQRYRFNVTDGLELGAFSAGRCSGPLARELATVLPAGTVNVAGLSRRPATFDLRGRTAIAAGPFSGEMVSTLRARMQRPRRPESYYEVTERDGKHRSHRLMIFEASFRVKSISGALTTSFAGTGDPFCRPLDSCDSHGSSTFTMEAPDTSIDLFGTQLLAHGERASLTRALRDLRSGRMRLHGQLNNESDTSLARVASTVIRADGSTCVDPGEQEAPADLQAGVSPRGLRFLLNGNQDALRTHCPGPSELDVVHRGALAGATLPVDEVVKPTLQLRLLPSPFFGSTGYSGTRSGGIVFDLERTELRVSEGTEEVN